MMRPRMFSQPWLRAVATWGALSVIESVQRGEIAIASGASSNTATITAVDLTRARVVFGDYVESGATDIPANGSPRIELTNATTVTASRSASPAYANTLGYEVIQYRVGIIKRIQRGTYATVAVPTGSVTISEVELNQTTLDSLNMQSSYANPFVAGGWRWRQRLTNTTTISGDAIGSIDRTIGYQTVEWN